MHVVYRLHAGGMEHGVIKLANGLDRMRVETTICSTCPATEVKHGLDPAVPLFELGRRNGNDPALVWTLARLLRRERPDVLHTHAWGTLLEGLIAARIAGVKAVVHGEHGTMQTRPLQVWAQRWAWRRVDQVLSVSSRLAERMAAEIGFPLTRIRTIRNGVDLHRFHPAHRAEGRARLGVDSRTVAIGTAGRLVEVKDHATLIHAAGLLRDSGVPFMLFIAGEGPLRSDLEARIQAANLGARVRLLGHRPDVHQLLTGLDVFVLSSRSEGLPNTILEAMASGVPVVSTRVGGADELVDPGRTGLLVPSQDPQAMAAAVKALLTDRPRREAMAFEARCLAEREFALGDMLGAYERLYLEVSRRHDPAKGPQEAASGRAVSV